MLQTSPSIYDSEHRPARCRSNEGSIRAEKYAQLHQTNTNKEPMYNGWRGEKRTAKVQDGQVSVPDERPGRHDTGREESELVKETVQFTHHASDGSFAHFDGRRSGIKFGT
jgi:hypothetical protein